LLGDAVAKSVFLIKTVSYSTITTIPLSVRTYLLACVYCYSLRRVWFMVLYGRLVHEAAYRTNLLRWNIRPHAKLSGQWKIENARLRF
jgi:hypothetical protein